MAVIAELCCFRFVFPRCILSKSLHRLRVVKILIVPRCLLSKSLHRLRVVKIFEIYKKYLTICELRSVEKTECDLKAIPIRL